MADDIIQETIRQFRRGDDLSSAAAPIVFDAIITEPSENHLNELLLAWNDKGISQDELFSLALIMRSRMKRISSRYESFIDAVGTGGSLAKTFNVSTAAAFVIAGADVAVAKHGNRAASSKTGSADVLTELGVQADIEPDMVEYCLNNIGICFMFAPRFHSLSPILAAARRRIGRPTIFNCLGPLCNPAEAPHQLVGAWNLSVARSIANALARLGTKRSWVVHAQDGLDEISSTEPTRVFEICCDKITENEMSPSDFGVKIKSTDAISKADSPQQSAAIVRAVLNNDAQEESSETLVAINAAAGIYLANATGSLAEAFSLAIESIRSGNALEKLTLLTAATNK